MIATIFVIAGALLFIVGIAVLVRVSVISRIKRDLRIIDGEIAPDESSSSENARRQKQQQFSLGCTAVIILGLIIFFMGWYLGYADKGDGFLFKKLIKGEDAVSCSVKINDKNQYMASDGNVYSYYIWVRGNDFEFCGEKCDDIDGVRERLANFRRENTVMLVDEYAVADKYAAACKLLRELGINYETEEV